jgi:DNA primase
LEYIRPGKTLRFCRIPNGFDPDSYIREKSAENMVALLERSLYLVDFLWENFTNAYDQIVVKTPEHIAAWRREIFHKLSVISNAELRNLYISEIRDRIVAINRSKREAVRPIGPLFVDRRNSALLREAILLYIIVKDRTILHEVAEQLSTIAFSDDFFKNIMDSLLNERELDGDDVAKLEKIAKKYCDFNQDNSLDFWYDVYKNHVLNDEYSRDLKLAKEELKADPSSGSWERLKALKLGLLRE